VVSIYKREF